MPVTSAATRVARASRRAPSSSPTTASTATGAITQRIQANDSDDPASSTKLHAPVAATIIASGTFAPRTHNSRPPIATSAAIPGTSATV